MRKTEDGIPIVVLASRALIYRENGTILLLQRDDNVINPEVWEFPGGKYDGDISLDESTIREVAEETGLDISVGEIIDKWDERGTDKYAGCQYLCLICKGSLNNIYKDSIPIKLNPNEHQDHKWVSLYAEEVLEDLKMLPETKFAIYRFIRNCLK